MSELDQKHLDDQREALAAAEYDLFLAVQRACPAGPDHLPVQHRDRKPPWCKHCRRTSLGEQI